LGEVFVEPGNIGLDDTDGLGVILIAGHLQEIVGLAESVVELDDGIYNALQPGAVLAEALGLLRIIPDFGVLELTLHFFESFALGIDVKDTP